MFGLFRKKEAESRPEKEPDTAKNEKSAKAKGENGCCAGDYTAEKADTEERREESGSCCRV